MFGLTSDPKKKMDFGKDKKRNTCSIPFHRKCRQTGALVCVLLE